MVNLACTPQEAEGEGGTVSHTRKSLQRNDSLYVSRYYKWGLRGGGS